MVGIKEINESTKALLRNQKYNEALRNLQNELDKQPNQIDLLSLASDICRRNDLVVDLPRCVIGANALF